MKRLLPGESKIVRLKGKGYQILKILENGVSKFPALEGRFPMVSKINFSFNQDCPAFQRIEAENVFISGQPLELDKEYTISTREFLYNGYDGYEDFPSFQNIDTTDLETITDILLKYFDIVRDLQPEYLNNEILWLNFGFEKKNINLLDLLRSTIIFKDERPFINLELLSEIRIVPIAYK